MEARDGKWYRWERVRIKRNKAECPVDSQGSERTPLQTWLDHWFKPKVLKDLMALNQWP